MRWAWRASRPATCAEDLHERNTAQQRSAANYLYYTVSGLMYPGTQRLYRKPLSGGAPASMLNGVSDVRRNAQQGGAHMLGTTATGLVRIAQPDDASPGTSTHPLAGLRQALALQPVIIGPDRSTSTRQLGRRRYELTDHLGNVRVVLGDRKLSDFDPQNTPIPTHFSAEVMAYADYDPFGSLLPGRNYSSDSYRFGFNGQEKDDEVFGATGTSYTAEFWQYDSRTGRRWNLDPVDQVSVSNYAAFLLNPIQMVDPLGNSATKWEDKDGNLLAENNDGSNQVITVEDEGRWSFDRAVNEAKENGVFDTKGGTEDINRATMNFSVKSWGTTDYYADRPLSGNSNGNGNITSWLGGASNATGFVETGLILGGELHQEKLFAQGFRLGGNGKNIRLQGRNLSVFGNRSPAPLSKLSGLGRAAGAAGNVLGVVALGSEWYDYSKGRTSLGLVSYHTAGFGLGLYAASAAGGPAGFAVGGAFYVGEKGYDAMWYLAGQMSAFEYRYNRMWLGH